MPGKPQIKKNVARAKSFVMEVMILEALYD